MIFRIVAVIVAAAMLITFLSPVVLKLRELSLIAVIAIGLVMMAVDLLETLRED